MSEQVDRLREAGMEFATQIDKLWTEICSITNGLIDDTNANEMPLEEQQYMLETMMVFEGCVGASLLEMQKTRKRLEAHFNKKLEATLQDIQSLPEAA